MQKDRSTSGGAALWQATHPPHASTDRRSAGSSMQLPHASTGRRTLQDQACRCNGWLNSISKQCSAGNRVVAQAPHVAWCRAYVFRSTNRVVPCVIFEEYEPRIAISYRCPCGRAAISDWCPCKLAGAVLCPRQLAWMQFAAPPRTQLIACS
jgi:hypothetical protein